MEDFFSVAVIIVAVFLVATLLIQARAGGGLLGGGDASYRTRRGVEKTLFQFTIILGVLFVAISILAIRF